jgi:hypothetical protein
MKRALIIIAVIAVSPLVIGFLWAAVSSILGRTQKRERAEAIVVLSQVPTDGLAVLLRMFSAFKLRNVEEANHQVATHQSEARDLLEALTRPRQPGSSAGAFGDSLNLTVWTTELVDQGYSEKAAAIISAVHHHHLDGALADLLAKGNADTPTSRERGQPADPSGQAWATRAANGPTKDMVPLPEWLEEKATDAPTMVRVVMDAIDLRLRREYPRVLSYSEWHRFKQMGTIAGCVALALRLHVDVPQAYRTPLELAMRASIELGFPGSEALYEDCARFVREALFEVERPKRSVASIVLLSTWVFGVVGQREPVDEDAQLIAELAAVYRSEVDGYWVSGHVA